MLFYKIFFKVDKVKSTNFLIDDIVKLYQSNESNGYFVGDNVTKNNNQL
jgi:hypothetical protein